MELSRRLPRFCSRVNALKGLLNCYDSKRPEKIAEIYAVERALLQLHIEWEHFVRELVLDSATGKFSNSSGHVRSLNVSRIRSREMVAHFLTQHYNEKEPSWHIPRTAIRAAEHLQLSNFDIISTELGISPWELDYLRYLRNFIAHRSKRAALEIRKKGLVLTTSSIDPVSVSYDYNSDGVFNYLGWVQFMKYVAHRLVS